MTAFKPTRRELADVRRFAREAEVCGRSARDMQSHGLPTRYGELANGYARLAFLLSQRIAARAGQ